MMQRFIGPALLGLCVATLQPAAAREYPARPVHWVVAFPAGGSNDVVARLMAQALSERLGQQFIVENKAGAGGNIGTETALRAPADGYTLLFTAPHNAINATLYPKLAFDFLKDSAAVAGIARTPSVMEVHPSVPARTVAEFIDYAKAHPGKINMASPGNGTAAIANTRRRCRISTSVSRRSPFRRTSSTRAPTSRWRTTSR